MLNKLLAVLILFTTSFLALALDDQGNPNDPTVNDRANACYEGGSMEGKCDTDWEWEAGWYIIRFDYGMISREDFPAQYAVLLPALPVEEEQAQSGPYIGCQLVPGGYVNFGSNPFIAAGAPTFTDAACTPPSSGVTGGVPFVWATTQTRADNICAAHGFGASSVVTAGQLYHC